VRDIRAGAWLDQAAADLTFAVRTHAKRPTATLVIIATLAIGIAATSISFSLVNGFFIRPIPIQPERFVWLYNAYKRGDAYFTLWHADFADMRALRDVFADAAAEQPVPFTLGTAGGAERVWGELVWEGYFKVLGVTPALGRVFAPTEDAVPGGDAVVVLSHGLWVRLFGGRPDVVDERLLINGHSFRVIASIALGLVAALGSARLLRTLLYSVSLADSVVFGVAPLALIAVCIVAAVPTWRALRINAAAALRYE